MCTRCNACLFMCPSRAELARVYTASDCFVSIDHVQLTCTMVAGVGSGMTWTVTIAGQSSVNPRTGYRAPFISGVAVVSPLGVVSNDSSAMSAIDTSGTMHFVSWR